MCDLKSHIAFRAKAEQGGHGGHSWGMAVGIPLLRFLLCSDRQLLVTSAPRLHTLTCRQAAQSLPPP